MDTVGAYEAKTHLSGLLDRVMRGERITIARHGVPVAMLVPIGDSEEIAPSEAIARIRASRLGRRLGGESTREMIEEGRR